MACSSHNFICNLWQRVKSGYESFCAIHFFFCLALPLHFCNTLSGFGIGTTFQLQFKLWNRNNSYYKHHFCLFAMFLTGFPRFRCSISRRSQFSWQTRWVSTLYFFYLAFVCSDSIVLSAAGWWFCACDSVCCTVIECFLNSVSFIDCTFYKRKFTENLLDVIGRLYNYCTHTLMLYGSLFIVRGVGP